MDISRKYKISVKKTIKMSLIIKNRNIYLNILGYIMRKEVMEGLSHLDQIERINVSEKKVETALRPVLKSW